MFGVLMMIFSEVGKAPLQQAASVPVVPKASDMPTQSATSAISLPAAIPAGGHSVSWQLCTNLTLKCYDAEDMVLFRPIISAKCYNLQYSVL